MKRNRKMEAFCPSLKESETRLVRLCEKERDPEGCTYGGRRMPGITRALRERFEPGPVKKRRGGSSREIGTRVHRTLKHALTCVPSRRCDCPKGTRPKRKHRYAEAILKKMRELELDCLGCEVPVVGRRFATRLDAVCRRKSTGRLCVVSFKTGKLDNRGGRAMQPPLQSVKRTSWNSACLQAACELAMLRRDEGISTTEYLVIWADKSGAKAKSLDGWAGDVSTQKSVLEAIERK